MGYDPDVWGPHYWFVIHTMALTYPINPNDTTKKKYYRFITDLPLFLPNKEIGNKFSEFLDKYPVTPYLDSRDSFVKWTHFIHNKINQMLKKPQITLLEFYNIHYEKYKPKNIKNEEDRQLKEKIAYSSIVAVTLAFILYNYKK
tara:strand:- start:133 stop:564 length:432 start_codon:yes stop_codon:yes gene_type:complete